MHQHKHLSIISIIITSPKRNSGKKRNFLHLQQRKVESRDSKYQEDLDSLRPPDRPPSLMNGDWAGARRLSHVMSHLDVPSCCARVSSTCAIVEVRQNGGFRERLTSCFNVFHSQVFQPFLQLSTNVRPRVCFVL